MIYFSILIEIQYSGLFFLVEKKLKAAQELGENFEVCIKTLSNIDSSLVFIRKISWLLVNFIQIKKYRYVCHALWLVFAIFIFVAF